MPLPATYDEVVKTTAIRFAKAVFNYYGSIKDSPWSSDPAVSAETGYAFFRQVIVPRLLQTVQGRMELIKRAKHGYVVAADALHDVLQEMDSRGIERTTELRQYDMELRARRHKPWPKRTRNKMDNLMRDLTVVWVVAAVWDRFPRLKLTQTSARSISVCMVVAEAMSGSGPVRLRAYHTVKSIWLRYQGAAPTVPGWSYRDFDFD